MRDGGEPLGELRGKALDSSGLGRMLKKYDVSPKVVRSGETTPRGYRREDLHDPWARYLEDPPSAYDSEGLTGRGRPVGVHQRRAAPAARGGATTAQLQRRVLANRRPSAQRTTAVREPAPYRLLPALATGTTERSILWGSTSCT